MVDRLDRTAACAPRQLAWLDVAFDQVQCPPHKCETPRDLVVILLSHEYLVKPNIVGMGEIMLSFTIPVLNRRLDQNMLATPHNHRAIIKAQRILGRNRHPPLLSESPHLSLYTHY